MTRQIARQGNSREKPWLTVEVGQESGADRVVYWYQSKQCGIIILAAGKVSDLVCVHASSIFLFPAD